MGKLIELHLCNFKSWAGTHVLHFGDSFFTSVIGPNGSGKSNTMDAISFVLGIKSSHLRSTHLRDLIYRGRVLKHSKVDANGDAVEATEGDEEEDDDDTQPTQRKDPHSAWVMAVYEDDAGEELRWKRTITAGGQSEYRINDRPVTAKQYNDALEAENILIKARNFLVFQGDVEAVASQQPKDLTRLLEQISGSLEYAKDYDALKAEKEKAEDEQSHKLQLRRGINGEIKTYQEQKQELDRFEEKREAKEQAVVTHVLWKLYHFQRTIEESTAEIQKHQEELKEFRRNVQKHEEKLDEARRDQAKSTRKMGKVQNAVKERERQVADKEQELLPVDEKLNLSRNKLQSNQKRVDEIRAQRDNQQKNADKLQKDYETTEKAQKRWEEQMQSQQSTGRTLSKADYEECESLRAEVYKQAGDSQVKVDNMTRQLKTDEEGARSAKLSVESMQNNVNTLQTDIDSIQDRRIDLQAQVKSATKSVQAKQVAINELTSERTRTRQKRKELDEKLRSTLLKLQDEQYQQNESRKDVARRETIAQMKRIYPGVRGMVHQLCKPKGNKYDTALPIILGRQWNSIIVDSEKTAGDCIQFLKDQRNGHMEFLPLDTIVHTQPDARLRNMHRGARLAIDTIEYDSSVERAMYSVCGNDMIADDWDIARELKWKRRVDAKIVTLDGRCITKADLISGGEGPSDRKRRFEDSDVEALRTLVDKLRVDLESLPNDNRRQQEDEQMQAELSGLVQKQSLLNEELVALEANLKSKTKELNHAKKQLAEAIPKQREQDRELEVLRRQHETLSTQVSQVEDQIFRDFCRRLGFANIREYERQQGSLQQEIATKKNEFRSQLSRLANQLGYERDMMKNYQDRIKNTELAVKRESDLIATLESQREELAGELDHLNAEIEQLNEQVGTLQTEHDVRTAAVADARKEVEKRSKSINKTLQAISSLDADVEKAGSERYMELRKCQVENISLPLARRSRSLDTLPLEDALPEQDDTAMDIDGEEAARLVKVKDYGIHPDFDELDDDIKNDDSDEMGASLQDSIISLQSELDKMAPNMRSTERLEATSERLRATDKEFNQARDAFKKASKAFETVKNKRKELFNKAFNHIRKQIKVTYRDLTKSESWPLGGQAHLDDEDEEEPYLAGIKYHATPPGKRFAAIDLLSGGEKTMAALALLFAIHSYAPSPFFVLDEVDAALDVANTTKLANYVKDHAGPGMQFVVISLKTGLFQNSETLVGVMRDQTLNSSKALMLDVSFITKYV
ncbi:hypothetical protein AMS68_002742 [Peltaster fructicola]|uniref:Structural maintenance of chromosomes protein n=1 Tax=Peltaster fructicola TaxID=286661 RepID=A0A6H0XRG5_9PEZI|nr:hypothetical protein AMS68_002742 [Peltaster fructicola]